MPYSLENRLVVGVASSAVFDLTESDEVFRGQGEEPYRDYQEQHLDVPLNEGVAFSFIRRLLSLNDLSNVDDPLVEVILLSRNDPDTGLRVMKSIEHHGLAMTRAIFMQGKSPYEYIPALNVSLFLSMNKADVDQALSLGLPAGLVLASALVDDHDDVDLRIAFDFDGVLVDDASERVNKLNGLAAFREHEQKNVTTTHDPGPLKAFLTEVKRIQRIEESKRSSSNGAYRNRLHIALVTARDAPAHERAIKTLKAWGLMVNDAFFLGGIEKAKILSVLRPHIYFDDQSIHLGPASSVVPSVLIPFGVAQEP